MKLEDKYGKRLHTKNFRSITSMAVASMDYNSKKKIIEIEFKTGKIYHYLNMKKEIWNQFLNLANKGESTGTYINKDFKDTIEKEDCDYYELVTT